MHVASSPWTEPSEAAYHNPPSRSSFGSLYQLSYHRRVKSEHCNLSVGLASIYGLELSHILVYDSQDLDHHFLASCRRPRLTVAVSPWLIQTQEDGWSGVKGHLYGRMQPEVIDDRVCQLANLRTKTFIFLDLDVLSQSVAVLVP